MDEDEKKFVPLVEPGTDQYIEILDLLKDKEIVVVSDDVTITLDSSGMPQPMKMTTDGLIKREADIISSDIPFNVTVCNKLILIFFRVNRFLTSKFSILNTEIW